MSDEKDKRIEELKEENQKPLSLFQRLLTFVLIFIESIALNVKR